MAGQGLIADQDSLAFDFFLLAHDPFDDGRLIPNPEILGYGLVGGKLADLVLRRCVRIDGDRVIALEGGTPGDDIDSYVVDAVRSQRQLHSVRSWFEPLQDELYELVSERLVTSGVVRREQGARRMGRGRQPDRFPAADLLAVSAPQQRIDKMMRSPKDLTLAPGMLVALLNVLGLDRVIAPAVDPTLVKEIVAEVEANLPTDLRAVYDAVKTLTGEASLRLR